MLKATCYRVERSKRMTEKMVEARVKKLRAIEAQQQELEAKAAAIKAELQQDMEAKGTDELHTKNFIVRWKQIIGQRLDTKALKEALPDIYSLYSRQTSTRRFTIA